MRDFSQKNTHTQTIAKFKHKQNIRGSAWKLPEINRFYWSKGPWIRLCLKDNWFSPLSFEKHVFTQNSDMFALSLN